MKSADKFLTGATILWWSLAIVAFIIQTWYFDQSIDSFLITLFVWLPIFVFIFPVVSYYQYQYLENNDEKQRRQRLSDLMQIYDLDRSITNYYIFKIRLRKLVSYEELTDDEAQDILDFRDEIYTRFLPYHFASTESIDKYFPEENT